MLEVGTVVAGKLRIEQLLGHGGMGVVAIATHLQLDQLVAVKVLHDELANDPTVIQRFLREAKASAQLKSEHVCRVSDVGQLDSGAPYIVMELLEGQDLSHAITEHPLPLAVAADYVLQACVAIAEAHALGIVHRDLKPGNLFVTHRIDGTVLIKVLDFGIAKAPTSSDFKMTSTQMVMGSPGYMSPEQLRSAKDVDARSDIWALGVILYECVSGRLPFPGTTITELAVKVAVDPPEPLDVDPRFAAIVMRCLEKTLERRYQNVGELATDLVQLAGPQSQATATLITRLVAHKAGASMAMPMTTPATGSIGTAVTQHTSGVTGAAPPASVTPVAVAAATPNIFVAPSTTSLQGAIDSAVAAAPPHKGRGPMVIVIVLLAAAGVFGVVMLTRTKPATKDLVASVGPGSAQLRTVATGAPGDAVSAAEPAAPMATITDAGSVDAHAAAGPVDAHAAAPVVDAHVATPADAHVATPADAHVATPPPPADASASDPAAQLHTAESSYKAGRYADALAEAEHAIRLGLDNNRPAHLVAAKAACQTGNADAARRHAKQLLRQGFDTVADLCAEHGIEIERGGGGGGHRPRP